jgi:hypothetical protein
MGRIAAAAVLALLGTAGRTAAQAEPVTTCVVRGAGISLFRMPASDTAAFQDSVRRAEPLPRSGYAGGQPWFVQNQPIVFEWRLTRYGLPRFIDGHLLRRVGEYQGVGIYAAEGEWSRVETVYLPVRAGCEFQPYQPPHWGIPCSSLGCPFPREEPPPGTVCRLRGDDLVWEREDEQRPEDAAGPSAQLAEGRRWYAADRPITFQGQSFGKMGRPRQLPPGSVRRIGEVDGVGVYVGSEAPAERVSSFYVPVRPGCEFQLYEDAMMYGAVRGD